MSFILDALKKSEADRQQQSGAAVSYVPSASRSGGNSRVLLVVTGLLAGTVIALLIILLRTQQSANSNPRAVLPAPGAEVENTPSATVASAPRSNSVAGTAGDNPLTRTEIASTTVEPAAAETVAENEAPIPRPAVAAAPSAAVTTVESQQPAVEESAAPVDNETYLTFNDLRATGKLGLPDMHIDLHVFSDKPSERFVFINMNQYRENATLTEGPRLRQIREDGVLLEYVGTTFLLPRE